MNRWATGYVASVLLALMLSHVGCTAGGVEMTPDMAERRAETPPATAVVIYQQARCFLYSRDEPHPSSAFARLNWEMSKETPGSQPYWLRAGAPSRFGPKPILARTLLLDEEFGFGRDAGGQLFAVAGDERIPMEQSHYRWEVVPLEYTPAQQATMLIFGVLFSGFSSQI